MKKNYHETLVLVLDKEILETEKIRDKAADEGNSDEFEGAELRLELLEHTKKSLVEEVRADSVYFSLTDAIEQEIERYDTYHEKYLHLKFGVEFDRKNLKIDEQAELARAKEDGLKLTNDDMRKAHLNEALAEEYKALFDKRGRREHCYHEAEVAKFYMKYYMARYENSGNLEVEDRLFEEKQDKKEEVE